MEQLIVHFTAWMPTSEKIMNRNIDAKKGCHCYVKYKINKYTYKLTNANPETDKQFYVLFQQLERAQ